MALAQADRDWRLWITVGLLLLTILGLQVLSHGSPVLGRKTLEHFPHQVGVWEGVDAAIDDRVQELLGATDLLNRVYTDPQTQTSISMFVSFYASQRTGGTIHSPKNCLPGAGWSPAKSGIATINVPGYSEPIAVNHYIIEKGLSQQVVLYWYQSQGRIIASEYSAKICLVWDAITKNRTDGALVRIVTPVLGGDEEAALQKAKSFVQEIFPHLTEYIPS